MSRENVDLVLESIRRFNPGDMTGWAELWRPETRLSVPDGWPEPGPFVGLEAVTREFERGFESWSEFRFEEVEVLADPGDWVVVSLRLHTKGQASGLEADVEFAVAYRVEDGLLAECAIRWRGEEALDAVGVEG